LGFILRLPYWLHPELLQIFPDTNILGYYFYASFFEKLSNQPHLQLVIAYLLTFILALYFNSFLNKQRLLTVQNYYPTLILISISALFPQWCVLSMPLIVSFIVLLLFQRLILLYRKEKMFGAVFDVGMLAGIAILCYGSMIWLALFLLFTFIILRAFVIREWVNLFVGMLVPLFLTGTWLFFINKWHYFQESILSNIRLHPNIHFSVGKGAIASYALVILIGLLLWILFQSRPLSRLVLVRKVFWLWFHLSWIILVSYFFVPNRSITHFYLFILPFSFYLSYYLCIEKNKWIRNFMYMGILLVILFNYLTL
jgi:hypothetical protein